MTAFLIYSPLSYLKSHGRFLQLIDNVDVVALIHHKPGFKAKISIRLTAALAPGFEEGAIVHKFLGASPDDETASVSDGLARAGIKLHQYLMLKAWRFLGITNDAAKRHVCIVHIPGIATSYSFKTDEQTAKSFNSNLN